MALIPPDVGIRMRLQAEASLLQPTSATPEIPSDLPELRTGQAFTAVIQQVLPENTYKALVAGKQLTLQLPEGAQSGDTLELVVIDRTPKAIVARLADATGTATAEAAEPYPYATLSRTGQMIGQLLVPEGETPQPAPLNRGQPLMSQPPTSAAELAPALQKAVTQSGLFYEAHQAQWVSGRLPAEQLLQEPQGRFSAPAAFEQRGLVPPQPGDKLPLAALLNGLAMPRPAGAPAAAGAPNVANPAPGAAPADEQTATLASRTPAAGETARAPASPTAALPHASAVSRPESNGGTTSPAAAGTSHAAPAVPQELRPLVQQQLDAAATQRLMWHGEVWPNQTMDWEVVREGQHQASMEVGDEPAWRTRLALDTPRLGRVEANLRLTSTGLQVTLAAPSDAAAGDLRDALPALAASLDAAGISLLSVQVKHEPA